MKIGAAQFASEGRDVDANVRIHLDWIRRGHGEKLDLLVMPEMSLTGHYGTDDLLHAAMTCSDPRLIRLAEEARDMVVVVGFIEEGRGFIVDLLDEGDTDERWQDLSGSTRETGIATGQ